LSVARRTARSDRVARRESRATAGGGDGSATAEASEDAADLAAIVADARSEHVTAQELVLDAIRRGILEGVLAPGARLRQEDLATVFATSRIPVREALRALQYEGLVESEPHRGFTVKSLDADEIDEIYDLRTVLETHAVRLAVPLLTEADLVDLTALYRAFVDETDLDVQFAARERYYMHLYSISGRPRLVSMISRLRQEVARSVRWKLTQHSPSLHDEIFEAITDGDAERAAQKLAAHYRKVAALLHRYRRNEEQGRRLGTDVVRRDGR
jgi:DNA-binding GntR family transcriptional regulator